MQKHGRVAHAASPARRVTPVLEVPQNWSERAGFAGAGAGGGDPVAAAVLPERETDPATVRLSTIAEYDSAEHAHQEGLADPVQTGDGGTDFAEATEQEPENTLTQPEDETKGAHKLSSKTSLKNLGRNSLILTLGTFFSRATGQIRTILLVAAIGIAGTAADAFDIANTLPNMLFALLAAGILQAVLMPQIMQAIRADNTQERLDKLLTISAVALLAITVVLVACTPLLIRLFTLSGAWNPAGIALAVAFAYWCIPQVFFYGVFTVLSEVLNARGQFAATGWAPVANNVISIAGFGAFIAMFGRATGPIDDLTTWVTHMTMLLGATATLGIIAQAAIVFWALRRGGFRWKLEWGLHGIGLRSASRVVGWTIAAVALEQAGLVFLRNVTSAAGQHAAAVGSMAAGPAAFTNAMTIYMLPHSLVVVSIVTALFPRLAMSAAERDLDSVRATMSTGLRSAGVFAVISSAVLITLAEPIMKSLLPTLSEESIHIGAPVLRALSAGLIALGCTVMVKRMYFAFEDGKSIFIIQIFATIATVAILWLSMRFLDWSQWAIAAGAAYAAATWISFLLRIRGMSRKLHGMDGARILRLYTRAGLAGLFAAGVGFVISRQMGGYQPARWGHALLVTVVAGLAMLAVYALGLKIMQVSEFDTALAGITKKLKRR
jgi:putative peptidoglycan lipid II flippase